MSETICAVVVTYNRKQLLLKCLEGIIRQTRPVDGIYLIDNASTDGTPLLLLQHNYIKVIPPENLNEPWEEEFEFKNPYTGSIIKFHYVRMHKNTGGAGGFHEGVKRAYEKGYDWFWLMDDDAIPTEDCLKNQIPDSDNVITGPIVIDDKYSEVWDYSYFLKKNKLYAKIYTNICKLFRVVPYKSIAFNGFLISKKTVEKIGFPNPKFFTQCDDVEYSLRAARNGYILHISKNAKLFHPKPIALKKDVSEKILYYIVRNNLVVARNYDFLLIRTIRSLIRASRLVCRVNHDKRRVIFKAILDGLKEDLKTFFNDN